MRGVDGKTARLSLMRRSVRLTEFVHGVSAVPGRRERERSVPSAGTVDQWRYGAPRAPTAERRIERGIASRFGWVREPSRARGMARGRAGAGAGEAGAAPRRREPETRETRGDSAPLATLFSLQTLLKTPHLECSRTELAAALAPSNRPGAPAAAAGASSPRIFFAPRSLAPCCRARLPA